MQARLKHLVEVFRSSFWPVPAGIGLVCYFAAEACLWIDRREVLGNELWFYPVSATGARTLLSTSAGGMITLAALAFSTTLVALTLASSQFGPRLLHNFIRARGNQVTLGSLLGTFLFCLVVLRSTSENLLPHFSVLVAFLLTMASLAVFLYFVHHLVRSLQAENVAESVARTLYEAIEETFPDAPLNGGEESEAESERESWNELENEVSVASTAAGYLQFVDLDTLVEMARAEDCRIRLIIRPGQLVLEGGSLFAYERGQNLEEEAEQRLRNCFVLGAKRTPEQDFEFEIRQLVEVGVRALSPGVNDPFTAINCIDLLAIALSKISRRSLPETTLRDSEGAMRVRTRPTSFRNLLETAYLQIRHDGADRPDVSLRLFEALVMIAEQVRNKEQLRAIQDFGHVLEADTLEQCKSDFDRRCLEEVIAKLRSLELRPA